MIQLNQQQFFMLFACCISVQGATRSIICDLQRNSFIYIPNELHELLVSEDTLDLSTLSASEYNDVVDCINYLIEENYGFYTQNPENFTAIDFSLDDYPNPIKNAIIDFDEVSSHDLVKINKELSSLLCSAVELRYFFPVEYSRLLKDLIAFNDSSLRSINLLIQYKEELDMQQLVDLCTENKRIKQIIVHGAASNTVKEVDLQTIIIYTKEIIHDQTHCGAVSPYYFRSNLRFFKESLEVNNCLDKKIGIDVKGNIKNCPSLQQSFGHIDATSLTQVAKQPEFQKVWSIRKDEISICKDCEFRYICLDCRAYTQSANDVYAKPLKCKYDPYSATWEN